MRIAIVDTINCNTPVVVNYSGSAPEAKEVVDAIEITGGKAIALQANLSRADDIRRLFQEMIER